MDGHNLNEEIFGDGDAITRDEVEAWVEQLGTLCVAWREGQIGDSEAEEALSRERDREIYCKPLVEEMDDDTSNPRELEELRQRIIDMWIMANDVRHVIRVMRSSDVIFGGDDISVVRKSLHSELTVKRNSACGIEMLDLML